MTDWSKLLNEKRFSNIYERPEPDGRPDPSEFAPKQFRLPAERDHDRILFSTPFRRMGDKTQVFPLENIESIRTRLTHSYEVANLARSIGIELAVYLKRKRLTKRKLPTNAIRIIPSILAAVGLAHDIGNPPFGHKGEEAIRSWFERNSCQLFKVPQEVTDPSKKKDINSLTKQHKSDFLNFDGNAQTLRALTKLQIINDDLALNLCVSTLTSLMKYVSPSHKIEKNNKQALKKMGYFASEQTLVQKIRQEVGLKEDSRHPLALVMEACDDIAYSVLDAEDSVKKGLVSFNDLLAFLKYNPNENTNDPLIKYIHDVSNWEHETFVKEKLHPNELNDVSTQKFRVHAIHVMVCAVVKAFKKHYKKIVSGKFDDELIQVSDASNLCTALKKFISDHIFNHRTVLKIELNGYNTINQLMDYLWSGISDREDFNCPASKRTSPFSIYAYSKISKNYRRLFEGSLKQFHQDENLPIRYKEMQLLTDMVSGMTDQFCIDLHKDLKKHYVEMHPINGAAEKARQS